MAAEPAPPERLRHLDVAKGIGIVLLFYGHFVEHLFLGRPETPLGRVFFLEWKAIYAFHMPLFFFVAGVLAEARGDASFRRAQAQVLGYLHPYVVAGVGGLLVALLLAAAQGTLMADLRREVIEFALRGLAGQGPGIGVTWFLAALAEVLVLHFLLSRTVLSPPLRLALFAVLGGVASMVLTTNALQVRSLGACTALFLLGVLCRRHQARVDAFIRSPLALLAGALVLLLTFDLNDSPLARRGWTELERTYGFAVLLSGGQLGNPLLFALTAAAGIAAAVAAARRVRSGALAAIGAVSLEMFILNGFLWKFANRPLADLLLQATADPLALHLAALAIVAVSLALCYAAAVLLRTRAPFVLKPTWAGRLAASARGG